MRSWDRRAALSCDRYLAVSTVVQRRIADAYGISADVLFPPVAMSRDATTEPIPELLRWLSADGESDPDEAFYLCVSRLLPYKNVDAVVGADRDQVFRITITDREDGGSRGIPTRTLLGDPQSGGFQKFKAGVLQLAAL